MDDDELGTRFRAADPAVTKLDAEASLREMSIRDAAMAEPVGGSTQRRVSRRWIAVPVVGALALAITVLVQVFTPVANPAFAATPPLLEGRGERLSIGEVSSMAATLLTGDEASRRRSTFEAWYVNTEVDGDGNASSQVSPQEVTRRWSIDLTGSIEVTAGTPYKVDGRPDAGPSLPKPGTVLDSRTFAAGEMEVLFIDEPPTTVEALRTYLASTGRDITDPSELIESITELRNEWTFGTATESAVLALLADSKGIEPIGLVTDRLGRDGWAFSADSTSSKSWRSIIVVSNESGEITSTERIYLGGIPDFNLSTPAVINYTAWK